jgi:hypothetical protein
VFAREDKKEFTYNTRKKPAYSRMHAYQLMYILPWIE